MQIKLWNLLFDFTDDNLGRSSTIVPKIGRVSCGQHDDSDLTPQAKIIFHCVTFVDFMPSESSNVITRLDALFLHHDQFKVQLWDSFSRCKKIVPMKTYFSSMWI